MRSLGLDISYALRACNCRKELLIKCYRKMALKVGTYEELIPTVDFSLVLIRINNINAVVTAIMCH